MLVNNPLINTLAQRYSVSHIEINPNHVVLTFCFDKCNFINFINDFSVCHYKIKNNRVCNLQFCHTPKTSEYTIKISFSLDGVYTPLNQDFVYSLKDLFKEII